MMNTKVGFTVRPLKVGAQIIGLDLSGSIAERTQRALYEVWLQYGVLVFRDTGSSIEQHLALSRCFGELETHPMPEIWVKDQPYLIELGGTKRGPAYVFDGDQVRIGRLPWHRDTAYTIEICKGAMLRMLEVPGEDGETLFADTAAAYDGLSEAMKRRIEKLEFKATLRIGPIDQSGLGAIWKTVRPATTAENPGGKTAENINADVMARYPSVIHPMVIPHPESGRICLYPSPTYVDEIIGMPKAEGDALMSEIVAHMTDERYCYAHSWKVNDMVVWDNRRFLHAAPGYKPQFTRTGYRTTLAGSLKSGRPYSPETAGYTPIPNMAD
jgi:taurine dioxygenase